MGVTWRARVIPLILVYCGFSTSSILTNWFDHGKGGEFFRAETYNFQKFASLKEWTKYLQCGGSVWVGLFVFVCFKITCSFLRSRSCCLLTYFKHAERVGPKKCVHPHRHIIPVQCAEELAKLYPAQETEVYQTSLDGKSPQDHPKG